MINPDKNSGYALLGSRRIIMRGFSLLELAVVIMIIGILIAVAASRLLPYLDEAERISVVRVEGQLRSSLVMEAAERIARGQSASIAELGGSNPISLLLEPPNNYLNETQLKQVHTVPTRHWYFDLHSRQLIYRPGLPYGLSSGNEVPENPAFAVRVEFDDQDGSGMFEPERDKFYGVRLIRVAGTSWLTGVM